MSLSFILLVVFNIVVLFALFLRKLGLQLQYLRLKAKKPAGKVQDFLIFDWKDADERSLRVDAFLLFPMLYPVLLDEQREELNELKMKVKRAHIGIYFAIILFIILGIFSERILPA